VRVLHVEAVVGVRTRGEPAPLELRLDLILVPVLDRIGDVIDLRRRSLIAGVAGQEPCPMIAEREVALPAGILEYLHPEEIGIEIAGFAIVRYLKRDVIDGDGLESLGLRRGNEGRRRG